MIDKTLAAFAWMHALPEQDLPVFVAELAETLEKSRCSGDMAPITQMAAAWRHTGEIHADPELLASLRQDSHDFGAVPAPLAPTRQAHSICTSASPAGTLVK